MKQAPVAEPRPYHHGDLRRGLIDAARRRLEAEGVAALSLRAAAREAGVSPAAPYHHFKDKSDLLQAIAELGWTMLDESMSKSVADAPDDDRVISVVLGYVRFARANPALYQVMFDAARNKESLPHMVRFGEDSAYARVRETLLRRGDGDDADLELTMTAIWCASHGLAELAGFKQFEHLKAELGGEAPFLAAVLRHMSLQGSKP